MNVDQLLDHAHLAVVRGDVQEGRARYRRPVARLNTFSRLFSI